MEGSHIRHAVIGWKREHYSLTIAQSMTKPSSTIVLKKYITPFDVLTSVAIVLWYKVNMDICTSNLVNIIKM